ncbi:MAG: FHA domain-containing protein [Oscillospiraceae bacterium]|nr:FHA domain-containing protein [Oscillospiraceae bacterium]
MGSNIIVIGTLIFLLFSAILLFLMFYTMKDTLNASPHPTSPSNDKESQSDRYNTVTLNLLDVRNFIKAEAEIVYNGKAYSIDSDHYIMGHDEECNFTVAEKGVSGHHCKIDYQDNTFTLSDLGSRNGTYLNGEPVTRSMELHNGDEIRMGLIAVKFKRRFGDDNSSSGDVTRLMEPFRGDGWEDVE